MPDANNTTSAHLFTPATPGELESAAELLEYAATAYFADSSAAYAEAWQIAPGLRALAERLGASPSCRYFVRCNNTACRFAYEIAAPPWSIRGPWPCCPMCGQADAGSDSDADNGARAELDVRDEVRP